VSEPAIRVEHLSRRLEAEVPVTLVDDVSLEIRRGERVAITGPSGSGKSSLLYLLGLLDRPTAGHVWLDGVDTSAFDDDEVAGARLGRIGFVFQSHFLLPEFTALENVMLPMLRLGQLPRDEAKRRARELLASLGLTEQQDKLPRQLSGGQSQRVAIARALANDPVLILADEPTGNLDSASSALVQEIIRDLAHKHERAVAVVTHDAHFADTADRIVRIVDGRIGSTASAMAVGAGSEPDATRGASGVG
jgi:lipoprotein-releasing system ATP-binding protein